MDRLFLSPWTAWTLVAAASALLALALVRAFRERRIVPLRGQAPGLTLRVLALGGLLWIALNPTALRPREHEGKPALSVLVDTSRSMSVADANGATRLAAALKALSEDLAGGALREAFRLDARVFDEDARAANLADLTPQMAQGRASDLSSAISETVNAQDERGRTAGILLVSDGRATRPGAREAARLALARDVPLWTCCVGGEISRRDLWIDVPGSEVLAFAESEVQLRATLRAAGYAHRSFPVEVRSEGELVARLEAAPGPDGRAPVQVEVTAPETGERQFVFRVPAQTDEAETGNNERSVFVRAVGEKVRCLLVEGQPHWDTKFLVQSLKRNERVELTALYRLSSGRQFAVLSAAGEQRRETKDLFPRSLEQIAQYDAVFLGRGCEAFFEPGTEQMLTEFVARHGGTLIFYRGKSYGGRFPALRKLEPVVWGEGQVQNAQLALTREGEASAVFDVGIDQAFSDVIQHLPALDRVHATRGVKPLAVVLARADPNEKESPILFAYHIYGQGRVSLLNASGVWRWAFRAKDSPADAHLYDRFWSALLRWVLSGGDFLAGHSVALRSDRRLYTDEQSVRFLIRTRGLDLDAYRPRLVIRGPDLERVLEPRMQSGELFLCEAGPFPPGDYSVRLTNNIGTPEELSLKVDVVSGSVESRELSADPELMARLAALSQGRAVALSELADLPARVREWRARTQLDEEKRTLWDRWWWMLLLLAAFGGEWFLRRRKGLL